MEMMLKRSSKNTKRGRTSVALALVLFVLSGGACASSSSEKKRVVQLSGGCTFNSDCAKGLVCTFERCHEQCKEDVDCDDDLRCVKSETEQVFVCQLEDETGCERDKDCPGEQSCGVDQECRDGCTEDDDCVGSQICAKSGECASTETDKDQLDALGNIVVLDAGSGGTPGGSGSEGPGSGGSGAKTSVGGGGGAGGEPASEAGATGADSVPATNPGGFPDADYVEQPDVPEAVDNGTRETALPITSTANINLTGSDRDFLSYTVPDDGRSHVITLHVEQEAKLSSMLSIYAAADNTRIVDSRGLGTGTTRDVYVTVYSGTTTLFELFRYNIAGTKGNAYLTFTDTPENDEHEPNDDYQSAKAIELDQSVSGQLLNPWRTAKEELFHDWFAIDFEAGTYLFTLTQVPEEGRLQIVHRNPDGDSGVTGSNAQGAVATYTMKVTQAGTHRFDVRPKDIGSDVSGYAYDAKPKYLDQQYTFVISKQP
jgi:hypothetical protein